MELAESEALCLEAIRAGFTGNTAIALETKHDLKAVAKALERLRQGHLIRRHDSAQWRATVLGENCEVQVVPHRALRRRGRPPGEIVAGSAGEGLLRLLDRPRRGHELLAQLGISRQRLHQLIVRFHAEGRLRIGDPSCILHMVARNDDPSTLLTRHEELVLSAMAEGVATTIPRLGRLTRIGGRRAGAVAESLAEKGLIAACGEHRSQTLYSPTTEGRNHFQRRNTRRATEPLPLEVRSDRVYSVLACLAERRRMRTRDLRDELDIPSRSMNALMQYLKRKGLVEKSGEAMFAPYQLAQKGRDILEEFNRRRES